MIAIISPHGRSPRGLIVLVMSVRPAVRPFTQISQTRLGQFHWNFAQGYHLIRYRCTSICFAIQSKLAVLEQFFVSPHRVVCIRSLHRLACTKCLHRHNMGIRSLHRLTCTKSLHRLNMGTNRARGLIFGTQGQVLDQNILWPCDLGQRSLTLYIT